MSVSVNKFEGHITLDLQTAREHKEDVLDIGRCCNLHYSEIAGWDEIRPGHHAFLTGHSDSHLGILRYMEIAKEQLELEGVKVLRMKVELCTYDERFK